MIALKSRLFKLGRPTIITQAECNAMFARFSKTRDLVYRTAHGLTPAQLQYRPDASRWSVAENLEHMTIVEQHILAGLTQTLQKPPDPAKKPAMTDEQLLANFGRVVQPITAPEPLRPTLHPCNAMSAPGRKSKDKAQRRCEQGSSLAISV